MEPIYLLNAASTTGMTEAFSGLANQITGALKDIAPVAFGVAGVFLAWRYGMRFFKQVSK